MEQHFDLAALFPVTAAATTPSGSSPVSIMPATISIRHSITSFEQLAVHFAGSTAGVTAVTKTVGVTSIWQR